MPHPSPTAADTLQAKPAALPPKAGVPSRSTTGENPGTPASHPKSPPSAAITDVTPEVLPELSMERPVSGDALRKEAKSLVEDLVTRYPQSADAFEVKARIHLLVGETDAARECWDQALKFVPDYGYAIHGLGRIAMMNSQFEEAVSLFTRAHELQADSNEIVHELSRAHTKLGAIDQSIEILKSYVERDDQSTETWVLLGQAYLADRQFEPARQAFEKALVLFPDLPSAQQGLGTVLVRLGQREKAAELLKAQQDARKDTAKNRTPEELFEAELVDVASRYVFAGRVYLANTDAMRAERTLIRATVFNPQNTDAWTALIGMYQSIGRTDLAVQQAERMWQANPESAGCAFTLGVLQAELGQVASAREAYSSVIRLAPESHSGYDSLVRLNIQTQTDLAMCPTLAEKLVQLRGTAADYELLGQAEAVNGKFDRAQRALEEAVRLEPTNEFYTIALQKLKSFLESQK